MSTTTDIRVETTPKRVRILHAGRFVADSTDVKLVWEKPYYPTYYVPVGDVATDVLVPTGEEDHAGHGTAQVCDVIVGDRTAAGAASWFRQATKTGLDDHVRFAWEAMDAWFEEDQEVFVHARDPYKRIDILQSSRHVQVEVDGVTVADSHQPRVLFETGLPPRFYLPKTDARMDLLVPSDTRTRCPYKGTAHYYDLEIDGSRHADAVWWYPVAFQESADVTGYVCFYNERVDLVVDGVRQDRPTTPFS